MECAIWNHFVAIIGNVTRECSSTGNWGKVDFTNCIIIAHDGFRDQVKYRAFKKNWTMFY